MKHFEMNLNIWYYLPNKYLKQLPIIFSQMDGWIGSEGYGNDSGYWYSLEMDGSEKYICCHHEPSGLYFSAFMDPTEWLNWKRELKIIATKTLGFLVGEPELGDCDCNYGDQYIRK